jgi:hypothetical protein
MTTTPSSAAIVDRGDYPSTLDGRYFVVRGRLWRKSNPDLVQSRRDELVKELMSARRDVWNFKNDPPRLAEARSRVNAAKVKLGERGPVWWDDGAPDLNQRLVTHSPYADWYFRLTCSIAANGASQ